MIDRLPPQSLEAEQSVLGAILIDRDAVIEVAEFLRPADFYRQANARIYAAVLDLFERREPIDIVTVDQDRAKHRLLGLKTLRRKTIDHGTRALQKSVSSRLSRTRAIERSGLSPNSIHDLSGGPSARGKRVENRVRQTEDRFGGRSRRRWPVSQGTSAPQGA